MEPEERESDVYYKIYLSNENMLCVVCMQHFDEYDYDQSRFVISKETSEPLSFKYKMEAVLFLNKNFQQNQIDSEFRIFSLNSLDGKYGLPN